MSGRKSREDETVGRQALYESLLVELPLAEFFLSKLCSSREPDVHALASLDPALYRGLLLLRAHRRQDVPDLGLDFTLLSDELGEQRVRPPPHLPLTGHSTCNPPATDLPLTFHSSVTHLPLTCH